MYGCLDYNKCCLDDCVQQEVVPKSITDAWNICWQDNQSQKDFIMCSLMERNNFDMGSYKKTIAWLDENCTCLERPCARGYRSYTDTNSGEHYCYKKNIITCLQSKFKDICVATNKFGACSKWQCGNYTVEVIK